jgi:hypothetical protein
MKGGIWVAVDFDNTIVIDAFPDVGPPVPRALEFLNEFVKAGANIVLWTIRCDSRATSNTNSLAPAVNYLLNNNIAVSAVNRRPGQYHWSRSPKCHASIYIDDKNICTPLITEGDNAYVDWNIVGPAVLARIEELKKKG